MVKDYVKRAYAKHTEDKDQMWLPFEVSIWIRYHAHKQRKSLRRFLVDLLPWLKANYKD